jgi:hypothetical protein
MLSLLAGGIRTEETDDIVISARSFITAVQNASEDTEPIIDNGVNNSLLIVNNTALITHNIAV